MITEEPPTLPELPNIAFIARRDLMDLCHTSERVFLRDYKNNSFGLKQARVVKDQAGQVVPGRQVLFHTSAVRKYFEYRVACNLRRIRSKRP